MINRDRDRGRTVGERPIEGGEEALGVWLAAITRNPDVTTSPTVPTEVPLTGPAEGGDHDAVGVSAIGAALIGEAFLAFVITTARFVGHYGFLLGRTETTNDFAQSKQK